MKDIVLWSSSSLTNLTGRIRCSLQLFTLGIGIVALIALTSTQAAEDPEQGDIRSLKVGVAAHELGVKSFANLKCNTPDDADAIALEHWRDFSKCAANDEGLRTIAFEYDDAAQQWAPVNDKWEGTKIAGHPVKLTLAVDETGRVEALHAKTDPKARSYMRKKAFLLSFRVKARYGPTGWTCERHKPSEDRQPVGGMFIFETCDKKLSNRAIRLHTELYRTKDQSLKEYVNATAFTITADPA